MSKLLTLSVGGVEIKPPGGTAHLTPEKVGFLGGNIIQLFINLLLLTAVLLAFFYLIWGGIDWILSAGDKNELEHARKKIIYAVLGLILVALSFFVIGIVGTFFNVELVGIGK